MVKMNLKSIFSSVKYLIPQTFIANLNLAVSMIMLVAILFAIYIWSEEQVKKANSLHIRSEKLTGELRQSSDDLTRMVRTYIETGDPVYKQYYHDIIDIRNGKIPRPKNYNQVYWDFIIVGDTRQNDVNGQAVALLDLMKGAEFSEQELKKLSTSKSYSDKLTEIEFKAMTLFESPNSDDKIKAHLLLFDTHYHQAKSDIMRPISDVIFMMNKRTNLAINNATMLATLLRMVLIVFVLGLVVILYRLYIIMKEQLGGELSKVQHEISRIGSADFTSVITVPIGKENSVLGWLARTQTNLITLEHERKQAKNREKARTSIFDLLARNKPIALILNEIIQLVEQENESSLCSILLSDRDGKHLTIGAASSLPDFYNEAINGIEIGDGVGSCGTAAFTRKRIIVEDIQSHPYWAPFKQLAAKANLGSCWSQPIIGSNQTVLGTFAIYHHGIEKPDENDIELIEFVAQLASIAIERSQVNEQLQRSSRVFSDTLEGIIITNVQQEIIDVNPAFCDITGYSREEAIGQNPSFLSSGKQSPEFYAEMWQSINESGHWQGEIWNRKKEGELYAQLMTISTLLGDNDNIINYIGVFTDITHSKHQQEKLSLMAHYDTLTGLPNRALFADRFQQAIAHSKRNDSLLAVCFLDLDNFKPVNDNYGHDVGDELLIEVAKRITRSIREEDTASRQGGDEFTLLLNDIESYEQCKSTLKRILHTLAQPYLIDSTSHNITASIGVTLYPDDNEDIDTLIRHADNAMYQAKQSGKNRYHVFDSTHDKQLVQKHHKLDEIQQALINNEFTLYYQPKVNMVTGEVFGAEALIRWNHPEKGLIPPLDFLPLIDATDLELQVGDWVIHQALQQMDKWLSQGIKLEVSVNIASHHIQSVAFFANLEAALTRYPAVDATNLQLEILENSALSDLHIISSIIKTCQEALGVTVALDDFGTGYSSLTHLRSLTANTIKIDQSFVRDMLDDPDDYTIIDGVIGLADSFGRKVIAEGVETTEHGLMLQVIGCPDAQGYSIAKPIPAADIPEWLAHYTPNQEWVEYNHQAHTVKENKIKLFKLTTDHWITYFIKNIQSAPENIKHWPLMESKHCHCGAWLTRKRKDQLFDSDSLDLLDKTHENVHAIAQALQLQHQTGNVEAAREGLSALQSAFDDMSYVLGQCK